MSLWLWLQSALPALSPAMLKPYQREFMETLMSMSLDNRKLRIIKPRMVGMSTMRNMNKKLYCTIGAPGSGKSTKARELQNADPSIVIIDKDSLRSMLHQGVWSKENEKQVVTVERDIVDDAIARGRSVVVHNTHMTGDHLDYYRGVAKAAGYEFELLDFTDVPVSVCIARDALRDNPVGEEVIRRTVKGKGIPEYDEKSMSELPKCIVVDIDGTLARHQGRRSPYDETLVGQDSLNERLAFLLCKLMDQCCSTSSAACDMIHSDPVEIFLMSGRHETCRESTEKWLRENEVPFDELYMRPADDNGPDDDLKEGMYRKHLEGKYEIIAWFDDRERVVHRLRSLGIQVLSVGYGQF